MNIIQAFVPKQITISAPLLISTWGKLDLLRVLIEATLACISANWVSFWKSLIKFVIIFNSIVNLGQIWLYSNQSWLAGNSNQTGPIFWSSSETVSSCSDFRRISWLWCTLAQQGRLSPPPINRLLLVHPLLCIFTCDKKTNTNTDSIEKVIFIYRY